jgi:hypothetical protein
VKRARREQAPPDPLVGPMWAVRLARALPSSSFLASCCVPRSTGKLVPTLTQHQLHSTTQDKRRIDSTNSIHFPKRPRECADIERSTINLIPGHLHRRAHSSKAYLPNHGRIRCNPAVSSALERSPPHDPERCLRPLIPSRLCFQPAQTFHSAPTTV